MCNRKFKACRSRSGGFTASKLERSLAGSGQKRPHGIAPKKRPHLPVTLPPDNYPRLYGILELLC